METLASLNESSDLSPRRVPQMHSLEETACKSSGSPDSQSLMGVLMTAGSVLLDDSLEENVYIRIFS